MLKGLPDFSCFKIFIFQCFKSVAPFAVQEWYPPTIAVLLQTPTVDSSSAQPTGADERRAVFSQPEIGDWISIKCSQYRQSASKSIVKLNYKIQYPRKSDGEKQSRSYFLRFFLLRFIVKITKTLRDMRIHHHVSCSQMLGSFPLGLCWRQPRNRQIHRQVCCKRHRISGVVGKERSIGFVGFLGNVEPKWCRKYRKLLCCEISQLNPDLSRVWPFGGIFCLTFFREGCSTAAPLDEPPLIRTTENYQFDKFRTAGVTGKAIINRQGQGDNPVCSTRDEISQPSRPFSPWAATGPYWILLYLTPLVLATNSTITKEQRPCLV